MYQAKDGKKFGSRFAGRRYDEAHAGAAAEHEKKESPEFEAGEQEGKVEAQNQEQHPVVAQHGRAHTVHVKHNHAANKHSVQSLHEDGHVNNSEHQDVDSAHNEAKALAGGSYEQPEQDNAGGEEMIDEATSGHKVPHAA